VIVTIHQPDFLPWLGFFDRWEKSDLYIVLDDVQFIRRGWHHRDKIKTQNGIEWLTVPVQKKGRYYQTINEVRINNEENWRHKHLETIQAAYRKATNFDLVYGRLSEIYNRNHDLLISFNMNLLSLCSKMLGMNTPVVFASEFNVKSTGSQRLVDLVKSVGGEEYLTGTGSRDYLDEELFRKAGIGVCWQEFDHPVYKQLHGGFEKRLSALDFLMIATKSDIGNFKSKDNTNVISGE
tara:strand:+ start:1773 stop:2483 length:711 start_codon:yes stop_codon:yes gene_type:complete